MFSYESLEVYKKAYETNQLVYRLLKENKVIPMYARNQLGRAALSVMLNIAEGSAKFGKKDRRNFFVYARGSAFESAAIIRLLHDEGEIQTTIKESLTSSFENISYVLYKMIKNLEN